MKFKTKEEFNKEHGYSDSGENFIVNEIFNSFAERVEFYKKYRIKHNDKDGFFGTELEQIIPDIWEQFWKDRKGLAKIDEWNDWLFNYCFGDVIE